MNLKKLIKVPHEGKSGERQTQREWETSQVGQHVCGNSGVGGCVCVWVCVCACAWRELNACDAFIENDIRLGHQATSLVARREGGPRKGAGGTVAHRKVNAIKATPKGIVILDKVFQCGRGRRETVGGSKLCWRGDALFTWPINSYR